MVLEKINLIELLTNSSKIHLKLDPSFLKRTLKKASNSETPHRRRDFCEKLGVKFNDKSKTSLTIAHWVKYNRSIPIEKVSKMVELSGTSWNEVQENILGIKPSMAGKEVFIRFPISLGKELGSIMGHILGDGSIDKRYLQVFYSNNDKSLLEEFSRDMNKVFGVYPRIWMQRTSTFHGKTRWDKRLREINQLKPKRNCGLFYPTICGVLLNNLFHDFAIGKDKKLPSFLKKTNKEFKSALIRAFFDDEGTVGNKNLRLFQDRKDILEDFRSLLKEFEIYPGEIKTYLKREKDRFYFDIHKKSNLKKFRDRIGFTSPKKRNKLDKICIIKNYKNSK